MANAIGSFLQIGLALILLGAGVINDLRERKVRNQIVIAGLIVGLTYVTISQGISGFFVAIISLMTAFVAVLPLYLMRIFGGGDVKLFLAVSVLLSWQGVLVTLFASVIWGSILGVLLVFLKGELKAFSHNLMALVQRAKLPEQKVHKIPFTIALFFGYLSSLFGSGAL